MTICCVCHEFIPSETSSAAKCGHVLHHSCWMSWLKRSSTCPECRQSTSEKDLIRLFLNQEGSNVLVNFTASNIDSLPLCMENLDINNEPESVTSEQPEVIDLADSEDSEVIDLADSEDSEVIDLQDSEDSEDLFYSNDSNEEESGGGVLAKDSFSGAEQGSRFITISKSESEIGVGSPTGVEVESEDSLSDESGSEDSLSDESGSEDSFSDESGSEESYYSEQSEIMTLASDTENGDSSILGSEGGRIRTSSAGVEVESEDSLSDESGSEESLSDESGSEDTSSFESGDESGNYETGSE